MAWHDMTSGVANGSISDSTWRSEREKVKQDRFQNVNLDSSIIGSAKPW